MVSNRTLSERKTLPRALGPVLIDSGGFSEIQDFGRWRTTPKQYAYLARRYVQEIGNVEWLAAQDLMCEPFMLKRTGLTVKQHQEQTIANYLDVLELESDLPWLPVLQGWTPDDYFRHVDMYQARGVNLADLPEVGLGSVCRRQHLIETRYVVRRLHAAGLRLHGFGVKTAGLSTLAPWLWSSDSLAWSQDARREAARRRRFGKARVECPANRAHTLKTGCRNCLAYALAWRLAVLSRLSRPAPLFAALDHAS